MSDKQPERVSLPDLPPIDSSRVCVGPSGTTVRWVESAADDDEPKVYARTMQALASHAELQQDLCGKVAVQFLWPMALPTSPLYLMLGRGENGWKPRHASSLTIATWLNQLLLYFTNIYVQVAAATTAAGVEDTETERIRALDTEWGALYQVLDERLHTALSQLYCERPADAPERFQNIMRHFTLDYVHLLEYTLWRMADPQQKVPLGQLLTPGFAPEGVAATPEEQQQVLRAFAIKTLANNAQLAQHGCAHEQRQWFEVNDGALQPGEWISGSLAQAYYRYMDMDNRLQ